MRLSGIFILLIAFLWPGPLRAAEGAGSFAGANQLYEKGQYKEAIAAYQRLLRANTNEVSPNLLFNLGNAYFKNEQPGHAIANFRRAAALAPRDPDIQANLNFARDSITTTYQEPPYHRLLTWFKFDEVAVVAFALWWIFLLLLTAKVLLAARGEARAANAVEGVENEPSGFLRKVRINPVVVRGTFILFVIAAIFLVLTYWYQSRLIAVVVRETSVRFGPLEESQTAFTLREGAEIPVLSRRTGWVQIGDSARQGWVPERTVAVIH